MEKYCISVDWMQIYCMCNQLSEGVYEANGYKFMCRCSQKETALFKTMWYIELNDMPIAIIEQNPRPSSIKPRTTLCKLENRILYSTEYIKVLYAIIKAFEMDYKGITRLDLCYDCNYFAGHRSPSKFVNNYVLKPMTEKGGVYRKGSDKFTCHGSKSSSSSSKITSISYGSSSSRIRSYMYDKTIELQEVKDKPWIREMWEENGLISNNDTHVWRSEISIKSEGMDLLNMGTGQLFKLSPRYIEHYENLVKIFHYYAKKVFDFRLNNGQETKRNYEHLYLFECNEEITCKPCYISKSADTGRMEKICYNKLQSLSETYSDLSSPVRQSLCTAMDFLNHLSGIKLATTRKQAYKRYLDTLKCCAFLDELDFAYMETVDQARISRNELDAEYMYYLMNAYYEQ